MIVGPGVGAGGDGPGPGPGPGAGGMGGGMQNNGGGGPTGGGGTMGSGGAGGAPGCTQVLLDPGWEGGSPNANWTELSTYFTTPLCDLSTCNPAPRTGSWWFWGGGIGAPVLDVVNEISETSQTVTIPTATSATLTYYVTFPTCDTEIVDLFYVGVDGAVVYQTTTVAESAAGNCNTVYQQRSLDLSAYANGLPHTITFQFDELNDWLFSNAISSAWVDDVALTVCP